MSGCHANQCCAVLDDNTRCIHDSIPGSMHCSSHKDKAVKLYLKYKKLGAKVTALDFNKSFEHVRDHIAYMMKCYVIIHNAYKARLTHRRYAIAPECYDSGHNHQLNKLEQRLSECEKILFGLNVKYVESMKVEDVNDEDHYDDTIPDVETKIRNYTDDRVKYEREVNEQMDRYILQNRQILYENDVMISKIMVIVNSLFGIENPTQEEEFISGIVAYNVAHKLYCIGYLGPNYRPAMCESCNCGNFVYYKVPLFCPCIKNQDNIYKYFRGIGKYSLKCFYETLLFHTKKIKYVICNGDIVLLRKACGRKVLKLDFSLQWNVDSRQITLNHIPEPKKVKMSNILAIGRKRDKHYRSAIKSMC